MSGHRRTRETFESSAMALGGCVVQAICLAVVAGGILAYAVSSQFREMMSLGSLLAGIIVWLGIFVVIRWMHGATIRAEREGPRPRPPAFPGQSDDE